ncbi:hypothetical protein [Pectobacterium sp. B1J-3]|uniref:hypothetical protein n=1 Tax=Pectobacterium sp. B1J-3 TaxID=3385371 RepID=UPI003905CAA8
METVLELLGGAIGIYFIIAMLMFFYWFYFRKGSLKKSLLHIGLSLVLLSTVVAIWMIRGNSINAQLEAERAASAPKPITIEPELLDILANREPASVDSSKVAAIAQLANQRLGDAGTQNAAALKKYYIYYHTKLAPKKLPDSVAGIQFDAQRRNAERAP